jgi:hypothetical protein
MFEQALACKGTDCEEVKQDRLNRFLEDET